MLPMRKSSFNKMMRRLTPEVREDFLRESVLSERHNHIIQKDDKYVVDLNLSKQIEENKEFKTFEEADQYVQKFFETNPEESNYTDVEE